MKQAMELLETIRGQRVIRSRARWTRGELLAHQRRSLGELLAAVWRSSPFYRDYYSAHGLREGQLAEVTVRDLPIIDKEILMEHFDRVSPDPLLRRARIEAWIRSDAPLGRYGNRYVVVHTSGTSGRLGIYAYDIPAWARFRAVSLVRGGTRYRLNPLRRNRIAFCGAVHGRFAGVTAAVTSPALFVRILLCSVLDAPDRNVERLNRFRPEKLFGYPSALHELALRALAGDLRIEPDHVFCGGEVMSAEAAAAIERAWNVRPVNGYAASESMCIAYSRRAGPGMSLMEDEHVVEVLDERDEPVAPGETGRVVLTNLYNRAIPIIRYDLRDRVTRGRRSDGELFEPILGVEGRVNDALPVRNRDGAEGAIHPVVLSEFFVAGVRRFQFVSRSPVHVEIRYVADGDRDEDVLRAFRRILDLKGADPSVVISTTRCADIPADGRTGKYRLVVR